MSRTINLLFARVKHCLANSSGYFSSRALLVCPVIYKPIVAPGDISYAPVSRPRVESAVVCTWSKPAFMLYSSLGKHSCFSVFAITGKLSVFVSGNQIVKLIKIPCCFRVAHFAL